MTTKTKTNVATFGGKAESIIINEGGVDYKHAVVRGNILSLFSENGDSPWKSLGGSYTLFHLEEGVSYRVFVDLAAGEKDMRPEVTGELVGKWTYLAQPTKHEEQDSLGVWDDGVMVIAPVGAKNPLKEGKQYQVTVERVTECKFAPYMKPNITNPMIAKLDLALSAHAQIGVVYQFPKSEKPSAKAVKALVDAGITPKKQETIMTTLPNGKSPRPAAKVTIFPEEKLAVVEDLATQPIVMTQQNLFKYINSLSNINEYRLESTIDERLEWGLRLLQNFAKRA